MNKKGVVGVLLFALLVIFVVGFVWLLMDKPMTSIKDKVEPEIAAENMPTFNMITSTWIKWPIIMILMTVLYVIVRVVFTQPQSPYQYQ